MYSPTQLSPPPVPEGQCRFHAHTVESSTRT
jgi:hypothetical protein